MDRRHDSLQLDPSGSRPSPLVLAVFGLVEVVVACVMVVGFFAAASQQFGWSSALQFAGCAVLGWLLWYADRTLIVEPSPALEGTAAGRATICQ
jgi:threonine/homoserine/homoserine lactone efflux protein